MSQRPVPKRATTAPKGRPTPPRTGHRRRRTFGSTTQWVAAAAVLVLLLVILVLVFGRNDSPAALASLSRAL
jgi:hypothetical protein